MAVIAYVLEEDAAAERRDLQAGDVDVGVEVAPGVRADGVGYEGRTQAVEVEEEEDGQDAADEQLNQEDPALSTQLCNQSQDIHAPIEATARVQRLRDDSAGHGCSAVWRVGSGSSWCTSAHGHVAGGRLWVV